MNEAAEVSALLSLLVRAMVTDRDAVSVTPMRTATATVFLVKVAEREAGKLIGQSGRVARSLRIILHSIAMQANQKYQLDINGDPIIVRGQH